ncbi:bifunctional acetate--CoA ligase family protein/GNAT family N-acetyltransferase [Prosthecomicrobium sp. N25]|uniref:bifunctional acetate--CoA ligase family protein/GNAT family N-acetyltransferase n=1 Tax=Prosthecomicrobium sp. N25 TaxID=3129254 RepID=UPI003077CB3B
MTIRNLDGAFAPKSVAVVGPARIGPEALAVLLANLARGGFKGPVTLVRVDDPVDLPEGFSRAASIADVAGRADLAVVLTGPEGAPETVSALGGAGTRVAVFLSRGYDEWPADVLKRTLEAARPHVMRIVGPGSLGLVAPHVGLDASLTAQRVGRGDLAVISRSAAMINATLAWGAAHKVGFSAVVSLGQKADVDSGDLLDWLTQDHRTRAVLVHLETVGSPRKFLSAARACARTKPVVVIRTGASRRRTGPGLTHSSRLAATDAVYDAVFKRAGLLRVYSIDELFDAVETLSKTRATMLRQVAVVANGRSLATLAADHLERLEGRLSTLGEATVLDLAPLVRAGARPANPVVLCDDASPADFARAAGILLADPDTDAVVAIHAPNAFVPATDVAEALAALAQAAARKLGRKKPIITSFLDESPETCAAIAAAGLPFHPTPEEAVASVVYLMRHAAAQERLMATPPSLPADFTPDPDTARRIVGKALIEARGWLSPVEVRALLEAYDIPVAPTVVAPTPEAAVNAARPHLARGDKVAVKIASPDIAFKSDVDGVRLGLADEEAVRRAAFQMTTRIREAYPDKRIDGVVVMPMVERKAGTELIMGIADDPVFGPIVVFGRGGTAVEVLADRALDLVPLDINLARALVEETRVVRLLAGYRNRPAADMDAIALTLVKLSQLATDLPEVRELDLNPILADASGVIVLDARVRIAPVAARAGRLGHPRLSIRPYPQEWERRMALKDGRGVIVRPVRPEDEALYPDFFSAVTAHDLRLRFFAPIKEFSHAFLAKLTQLDYGRAIAFAAIEEETGKLLGVVRLHADPDHKTGEYAILLRSDLKGQGLGWKLMQLMIEWARADGIETVKGEVLRENTTMLAMCTALGFSVKGSPDDESIAVVTLPVKDMAAAAE